MGNLCSIHHANFNKLFAVTQNTNTAILLEKCIFWWQISTYTLDDGKIWFTRNIEDMAREIYVSTRSINRYLNDLENKGLIERTCRLGWSKKANASIKRLYIRITDKLLSMLTFKSHTGITQTSRLNLEINTSKIKDIEDFLAKPVVFDNDKIASSIYKDKDCNILNNNTVSETAIVNNLTATPKNKPHSEDTHSPIEQQIGERIDSQLKNYIKGTLTNLQTQHGLKFSNPQQVFAEMVFSVLNPNDQLRGIENTHHRVNIIAKLMREKRWLTPKGFYNHWDIGALFKKQQQVKTDSYEVKKQQALESGLTISNTGNIGFKLPRTPFYLQKKALDYAEQKLKRGQETRLQELNQAIAGEIRFLAQMQKYYGDEAHPVIAAIKQKLENYTLERAQVKASLQQEVAA